jgi:hypothetical protein
MADVKISALPLASTPLAGTEILPIVQSATTDQVTVANLTAGRAVSASSLTLTTPLSAANGGTGTATAFTAGSVVFAGASGVYSQDNVNFFWDDTNNRLGIGTVAPVSQLTIFAPGNFTGNDATYPGTLQINQAGISTLAATGGLEFKASVFGAGYGAKIVGFDNGSLAFGYRANSATWSESMRITNVGNVSIGDTTAPSKLYVLQSLDSVGFRVYNNNASFTSEAFQVIALRAATSAYTLAAFYSGGGGAYAVKILGDGSIYSATLTGGATTLSVDASGYIIRTPSDRNLKINDVEVPYGLSTVQKMRPIIHEWTTEANMGDGKSIGFIAQEMEAIIPEVISGVNTKSLDYGKLTPVLVKAIQELAAKVAKLEAKI